MTAKYYIEKYPGLIQKAAKIISAMDSECQKHGKIFDKLAEIFAEFPYEVQIECVWILTNMMKQIWNKFQTMSLYEKSKNRLAFRKEFDKTLLELCESRHIEKALITHMTCALSAVWKNINRNIKEQYCRIKFYNSDLVKFSAKFTK